MSSSNGQKKPVIRYVSGTVDQVDVPVCRHCDAVVAGPDQNQHMASQHPTKLRRRSRENPDFIQQTTRFNNPGGAA